MRLYTKENVADVLVITMLLHAILGQGNAMLASIIHMENSVIGVYQASTVTLVMALQLTVCVVHAPLKKNRTTSVQHVLVAILLWRIITAMHVQTGMLETDAKVVLPVILATP